MSDVPLGATLQLDIAQALALIDQIGQRLSTALTDVRVTLDEPDGRPVTQAIEEAVHAADTEVEADADADRVTSAIDDAVQAANTTTHPDAEAGAVTSAIDDAVAAADTLTHPDAEAGAVTVAIDDAVAAADTTVEPDAEAGQVTAAIDQAVAAADTTVEPEAEAGAVTSAIDAAVVAADTTVEPDAEAGAVTAAIDAAVAAAQTTVPVDADTSQAQADIAQLANVPPAEIRVDADTGPAEAAIAAVEREADGTTVEIQVEADTGGAEAAIESVGNAATAAGGPVDDLTESTVGLSGGLGEAKEQTDFLNPALAGLGATVTATSGSASGLGGVLQATGGKAGIAGAAITGVTAAVGAFFNAGLEAQVSQDRFNATLGNFADEVENINVGTLNGELDDLAARLGTSDEALQDAATGIFQLGQASGAAGPQVAQTTEEILALALRTKALRPELGEAGTIAEGLTGALARGGRALSAYGLSISSAAIEQRALTDTGKASADQLTQFERTAAGAALAAEQLGGGLDAAFREGEASPAARIARLKNNVGELVEELGAPLVSPVLSVLEALEPVLLGVVTALGSFVQGLDPIFHLLASLGPAIELVMKPMGLLGKAIEFSLKPIDLLASGIDKISGFFGAGQSKAEKFAAEVEEARNVLTDATGAIDLGAEALGRYIEQFSRFETKDQLDDLQRIGLTVEQVGELALQGGDGLRDFRRAADEAGEGGNTDKLVKSFTELQEVIQANAEGALRFEVEQGNLDASFIRLGESTGNWVEALDQAKVAQQDQAELALNTALVTGQLSKAQHDAAVSANTAADGSINYAAALKLVEAQQEATRKAQQQFATDFVELIDKFPIAGQRYKALISDAQDLNNEFESQEEQQKAVEVTLARLVTELGNAGASASDFEVIAAGLGVTSEQLATFVDGVSQAIGDFANEATSKLPTVGDAFTAAKEKAEEAERALSAVDIKKALEKQLEDVRAFNQNLRDLVAGGFSDLAGLAAQQGPEFVAAFAKAVRDNDTVTLSAIRDNLIPALVTTGQETQSLLTNDIGPALITLMGTTGELMAGSFGTGLNLIDPTTGALVGAQGAVEAGTPGVVTATGLLAGQISAAYGGGEEGGTGVGALPGQTGDALLGVLGLITENTPTIGAAAGGLAAAITGQFGAPPTGVGALPGQTGDALVGIIGLIEGSTPPAGAAAGALGAAVTGGVVAGPTGVSVLPGQTGDALTGLLGAITTQTPPAGTAAAGLGSAITTNYNNPTSGGVGQIPAITNDALEIAIRSIGGAAQPGSTTAGGTGSSWAGGFKGAFNPGMGAGAQAGVDSATAAVRSAGFSQAGPVRTAADTGTSIGKAFQLGFVVSFFPGNGQAAMVNAARNAAGAAAQVAGTAQNAGTGVGQAFGQGMVNGINSYVGAIAGAAANAVRRAEAAARAEARSQSPSQAWADIGRDMMLGGAQGITKYQGVAENAATAAAARIVEAARTRVQRSLAGFGGEVGFRGISDLQINDRIGNLIADQATISDPSVLFANKVAIERLRAEAAVRRRYGEEATLIERLIVLREREGELSRTTTAERNVALEQFRRDEIHRLEELVIAQRELAEAEANLNDARRAAYVEQQRAIEANAAAAQQAAATVQNAWQGAAVKASNAAGSAWVNAANQSINAANMTADAWNQAALAAARGANGEWDQAAAEAFLEASAPGGFQTQGAGAPGSFEGDVILAAQNSGEGQRTVEALMALHIARARGASQAELDRLQADVSRTQTDLLKFMQEQERQQARARGLIVFTHPDGSNTIVDQAATDARARELGVPTIDYRAAQAAGLSWEQAQAAAMAAHPDNPWQKVADQIAADQLRQIQPISFTPIELAPGVTPGGTSFGGGVGSSGPQVQVNQDITIDVDVHGPMSERAARELGDIVGTSAAQRIRDLQRLATAERLQNGG